MSVIRIKKGQRKPYVMLDTTALNDTRLSFRAKGLHTYLMSKPDDWQVYIMQLEQVSPTEGREAITSAIKELESAGYVQRQRIRGEKGRMAGWHTTIYETAALAQGIDTENGLADVGSTEVGLSEVGSSAPTYYCINQGLKVPKIERELPPVSPLVETSPKGDTPTPKQSKSPQTPAGSKRCPEDYTPTPAVIEWAQTKFPQVDFPEALDAMRDWEFKDTRRDWDAVLRTWIRNEAKRGRAVPGYTPRQTRDEQRAAREAESNRQLEDLVHGRNTFSSPWDPVRRHGPDVSPDAGRARQSSLRLSPG